MHEIFTRYYLHRRSDKNKCFTGVVLVRLIEALGGGASINASLLELNRLLHPVSTNSCAQSGKKNVTATRDGITL